MTDPTPVDGYLGNMLALVMEHGHAVNMVLPDDDNVGLAYTVGLTAQHRPELVCSIDTPQVGQVILNAVVPVVGDGPAPGLIPADLLDLNVPVRLRGPIAHGVGAGVHGAAFLPIADALYGADHTVEAWQVLWPDQDGVWPDEPAYDRRHRQTVFALAGGGS